MPDIDTPNTFCSIMLTPWQICAHAIPCMAPSPFAHAIRLPPGRRALLRGVVPAVLSRVNQPNMIWRKTLAHHWAILHVNTTNQFGGICDMISLRNCRSRSPLQVCKINSLASQDVRNHSNRAQLSKRAQQHLSNSGAWRPNSQPITDPKGLLRVLCREEWEEGRVWTLWICKAWANRSMLRCGHELSHSYSHSPLRVRQSPVARWGDDFQFWINGSYAVKNRRGHLPKVLMKVDWQSKAVTIQNCRIVGKIVLLPVFHGSLNKLTLSLFWTYFRLFILFGLWRHYRKSCQIIPCKRP